jgi:hypothetical protein
MKKEMIKPFLWGVAVGVVVLLIVIFSAGWVTTTGSAKAKAEEMAEQAVIDRLADICVAQFKQDPGKDRKLEEMKKESTWQQGDYVEKQGWATMPGSKSPDPEVADECAERILELKSK